MHFDPDPAARFVAGEVPREDLSPQDFLRSFQRRSPVVVPGGAAHTAAVRRWDPEYLIDKAGDATLDLLAGVYEPGARTRSFTDAREVRVTLADFVRGLLRGDGSQGYVFNTATAVFRINAHNRELQVGWAEKVNPQLAALADDFEIPAFLSPEDLIFAGIVLGNRSHKAPLHYDLGGEAKCLVQVRGRKRVLLFPPSESRFLSLPAWVDDAPGDYRVPHAAEVDIHAPDFARFPELERARCLEAVLEPGDVIYWPSFWFHDITNLDDFTLAVNNSYEELLESVMHVREHIGLLGKLYERHKRARGEPIEDGVEGVLREMEAMIQSDALRSSRTFWSWFNAAYWRQ